MDNIIMDICGSRTLECMMDCLAKFNRGMESLAIRAIGGNISRGVAVARLLDKHFGVEIQGSEIKSFNVEGTETSCMELNLKGNVAQAKPAEEAYAIPESGFVEFPVYHLLLDWWLSKARRLEIGNIITTKDNLALALPLIAIDEQNGMTRCCIEKEPSKQDFEKMRAAFQRCGLLFPANCRKIGRKLSEFDDIILGIDTNILYNTTVTEHLLPMLSLIEPKGYVHTPNWILFIITSAVMHELEESANLRDKKGFLTPAGRMGFRALQEIIELNQSIDMPGISLLIVGEADPVLDTRVELRGLRLEFGGLRKDLYKRAKSGGKFEVLDAEETSPQTYSKGSSGDMIIRDQFKNFLRQVNFHKGTYFLTADKSNTALARTEGLHPIYFQPPQFYFPPSKFPWGKDKIIAEAPQIKENPDQGNQEIRMGVPIGEIIYEMAVEFGTIQIKDGKREITLQCDAKGETLDNWVYRNLRIDERDFNNFNILLKDYGGKFGLRKVVDVWNDLIQKFIGLEEI